MKFFSYTIVLIILFKILLVLDGPQHFSGFSALNVPFLPVNADSTEALETKRPIPCNSHLTNPFPLMNSLNAAVHSDITEPNYAGQIGSASLNSIDEPYDNVFYANFTPGRKAQKLAKIQFDLQGLANPFGLTITVNNTYTFGGALLVEDSAWKQAAHYIPAEWLHSGKNTIIFSMPDTGFVAQVKNVRLSPFDGDLSPANGNLILPDTLEVYNGQSVFIAFRTLADSRIKFLNVTDDSIPCDFSAIQHPLNIKDGQNSLKVSWLTASDSAFSKTIALKHQKRVTKLAWAPSKQSIKEALDWKFQESKSLKTEFAKINLPTKALLKNARIEIEHVANNRAVPMGNDIINVSAQSNTYRFLPDGTIFRKPVELELAYDPALIPQGYTEKDIRTYYFDTEQRKWVSVNAVTIDEANNLVRCQTTHFTDYINGIIKVPESPETMAYTPTSIKDFKAGDASANIPQLQIPEPNNSGTLNTAIPILIPAGRSDMQPDVKLVYSHESGNGFCGLGWSLPISTVTIETRWGVPRYHTDTETETYMLNGEQLVGKENFDVAHRIVLPRTSNKAFVPWVEKDFRKIIRRGDNPKSYWWEVTEKDGRVHYYGSVDGIAPDTNSVLKDNAGNIARWNLSLTRDLNGNLIRYHYLKIDTLGGRQIYCERITYTGFQEQEGLYAIKFNYDTLKQDAQIDARLGFPSIEANLLKKIEVYYADTLIRQYKLNYKTGAFFKTLLHSVSEYDAFGQLFYRQEFDYFDDVRPNPISQPNSYEPYTASNSYVLPSDGLRKSMIKPDADESTSIINGSTSSGFGFGFYVGIGPIGNLISKSTSFGWNFNFSSSTSEGLNSLIDISGDNIPDKVFYKSGSLRYRLGSIDLDNNFIISDNVYSPGGYSANFSSSNSSSYSNGPQMYAGPVFLGLTNTVTTSNTTTYFVDRNGDGITDIVSNGSVRFGVANQQGDISYELTTENTENPIVGNSVPPSINVYSQGQIDSFLNNNPLHDVVKVWIAPFSGQVVVSDNISYLPDNSPLYSAYTDKDGVRFTLENNQQVHREATLGGSGNNPISFIYSDTINVTKNERIFFRFGSIYDGAFDRLSFNPDIQYTVINDPLLQDSIDVNGHNLFHYNAFDDFLINTYDPVVIYDTATSLNISGTLQKDTLTDDVWAEIVRTDTLGNDSILHSLLLPWDADSIWTVQESFAGLNLLDKIDFRVRSNTQVDWQKIQWQPIIQNSIPIAADSNMTIDLNPLVNYTQFAYAVSNIPDSVNSQRTRIAQPIIVEDTVTLKIIPKIYFQQADASSINGEFTISAKWRNKLIAKRVYAVNQGSFSSDSLNLELMPGDSLFLELTVNGNSLYESLDSLSLGYNLELQEFASPSIENLDGLNAHIYQKYGIQTQFNADKHLLFGPCFKNWGQFCYRTEDQVPPTIEPFEPIQENSLVNPDDVFNIDIPDPNSLNENSEIDNLGISLPSPASVIFVSMSPDSSKQFWKGRDLLTWIKPNEVSCSRFGLDNVNFNTTIDPTVIAPDNFSLPNKISRSESETHSSSLNIPLDIPFVSASVSGCKSNSKASVLLDVSDFNGDRYPDIVSTANIQFTRSNGLHEGVTPIAPFSHGSESFCNAVTAGGGTSVATNKTSQPKTSSSSTTLGARTAAMFNIGNTSQSTQDAEEYAGVNFNLVSGDILNDNEDKTVNTYIDINGDGLPDRFSTSTDVGVSLNLGYDFQPMVQQPTGIEYQTGKTAKSPIDMFNGVNLSMGSWTFGVSGAKSDAFSTRVLLDVNGDGLADVVNANDDGTITSVALNLGLRFSEPIVWSGLEKIDLNSSTSESVNAGFTFGIPIFFIKLVFSIDGNYYYSIGRAKNQFMDINGDGNADYLSGGGGDANLSVNYSRIGRTNFLKSIQTPFKGKIFVDYQRTPNTYDMPYSKWVFSSLKVFDGHVGDGVDTLSTFFTYVDGKYNRRERDFYGFRKIIIKELDENSALYRQTENTYNNDGYYLKGLLLSSIKTDAQGNIYLETANTYQLKSGENFVSNSLNQQFLSQSFFPALTSNIEKFYEGQQVAGLSKITSFEYDTLGNVTVYTDLGSGAESEKVVVNISYHNLPGLYLHTIPSKVEIFDGNGQLLRLREQTINQENGDILEIRQAIQEGGVEWAIYTFEYDVYGNITKLLRPTNIDGDRYFLEYNYDNQVHTYPVQVKDAFGYTSSSMYDYRFGQVIESLDMNGHPMRYIIDSHGRITKVLGPKEIEAGADYSIKIEYFPQATIPYSVVLHYDPEYPSEGIETVTFLDGLYRPLQVKKKASVWNPVSNSETTVMVASGSIIYDAFGRAIETHYPTVAAYPDLGTFVTTTDPVTPTTQTYDILDRKLVTTMPDGNVISNTYSIEDDPFGVACVKVRGVDANGKRCDVYKDIRERETAKIAWLNENPIRTLFAFNPVGDLMDVTDHEGHQIRYTYDLLGRKLSYQHPDAGLTRFTYDAAGNISQKATPNLTTLFGDEGFIKYSYDYNRLKQIDYPLNFQNRVRYHYGAPGDSFNRAGRVWLLEDASGAQEFFYDNMGNATKTIRSIVVSAVEIHTYVYGQEFDSWNRVQKLEYADGEVVDYTYNKSGKLKAISSIKAENSYAIVDHLGYDKFDQRIYQKLGNGAETRYEYEPERRRLAMMEVKGGANMRRIMRNTYSYDAMDNILSIENDHENAPQQLGGDMVHQYTYDDLYRLTAASGTYSGSGSPLNYALNLEYDNLYNIRKKSFSRNGPTPNPFGNDDNYSNTYTYLTERPHIPKRVGNAEYRYDDNGNMTGYELDAPQLTYRDLYWDEENRLQRIEEDGNQSLYTYDASGERVLKSSGPVTSLFINGIPIGFMMHASNFTMYVNPNLVVKQGGFTKHYYSENQRIATRTGSGTFQNGPNVPPALTAGGIDFEELLALMQQAYQNYLNEQGNIVPGHPTIPDEDNAPINSGNPVNLGELGNYQVTQPPDGWPAVPNPQPGGLLPGHPTLEVSTVNSATVEPGYLFIPDELNGYESDQYFYHPDHVGSSSYITGRTGDVRQHMEYVPFGETFVDEHLNTATSPYLYNGKELDPLTGLYYYGARYYDPKLSVWLSVDPLAEKMPDLSPYNYVLNNPIKFIDPDGRFAQLAVGFFIGAALEIGSQAIENDGFDKINWTTVGLMGVSGTISGGIASIAKAGRIGVKTAFIFDAAVDAFFNISGKVLKKEKVEIPTIVKETIVGKIQIPRVKIDKQKLKYLENQVDRFHRIQKNDNKGRVSRLNNYLNAKKELEGYEFRNDAMNEIVGKTSVEILKKGLDGKNRKE